MGDCWSNEHIRVLACDRVDRARISRNPKRQRLSPTMIPDIDIWRCAQLMVNNYGDEAALEAATTADEWLAKGNIEAQRVRMRIAKAIDEMRTVKPGETRN
jgi:hypothetical protein